MAKPPLDTSLRDFLISLGVGAFAALIWILYDPPGKKPSVWWVIGRIGVGMLAALIVGSIADEIFNLPIKTVWGLCGAAGIFGERVFVVLGSIAKSRGVDGFDLERKKDEKE